jgi:hypothetical protein
MSFPVFRASSARDQLTNTIAKNEPDQQRYQNVCHDVPPSGGRTNSIIRAIIGLGRQSRPAGAATLAVAQLLGSLAGSLAWAAVLLGCLEKSPRQRARAGEVDQLVSPR